MKKITGFKSKFGYDNCEVHTMVSEVINRTFGLQPIDYCPSCNTAIVETKITDFNQITKCPKCNEETISVHPAKFSPDDKYMRYRLAARYS